MKKFKGISLLEILLVLSIISVIATMSMRYYVGVHQNLQVTQAIREINRVTRASYTWLQENNTSDFSAPIPITLDRLVQAGLLAESDTQNNWGGSVAIAAGNGGRYVQITLNNIPRRECENLQQQLSTISETHVTNCLHNQYIGEF